MARFDNAHIRLKKSRVAAGFKSAKEFCNKYGVPSSTYSLHETGGRSLKPKVAEKYADLLGVDVGWLVGGTGSPYGCNQEMRNSLKLTDSAFILEQANILLLCKIINSMTDCSLKSNKTISLTNLTNEAIKIYKDIIASSSNEEDQLTMVDLAITIFKTTYLQSAENNG